MRAADKRIRIRAQLINAVDGLYLWSETYEEEFTDIFKLQDKLAPLHINLFVETSPAPIKYAMSLIGKCANTVRLPMVPANSSAVRVA